MAGVDLPTVKALMGHRGIKMTWRYTHLSNDHMHDAMSRLDQFGATSHQFSQQGLQQGGGDSTTH
jgi:hypothetical protein